MKKHTVYSFIFTALLLSACDNAKQQTSEETPTEDKIAVGTNINALSKTDSDADSKATAETTDKSEETKEANTAEYKEIKWQDLEIPGNGMNEILAKFDEEINSIPEGSPKEKEMLVRLQASLNAAPVNPELDKKKIKIAGFISPLEVDNEKGIVTEFLLVPYFGACIHVPPPPLNQTLLVNTAKDKPISLEDTYEPIWVSGVIHAESTVTKLAEAGYKISDVKIEPYRME